MTPAAKGDQATPVCDACQRPATIAVRDVWDVTDEAAGDTIRRCRPGALRLGCDEHEPEPSRTIMARPSLLPLPRR